MVRIAVFLVIMSRSPFCCLKLWSLKYVSPSELYNVKNFPNSAAVFSYLFVLLARSSPHEPRIHDQGLLVLGLSENTNTFYYNIVDTVTEDGYNTSFEGIHATTGDWWRQHCRHSRFHWKFGNAFSTSNNQVIDLYGILPLSFVDSDTNLRICGGCVLKVEIRNC